MKAPKQPRDLHSKVIDAASRAMKDHLVKGDKGNPPLRKTSSKKSN